MNSIKSKISHLTKKGRTVINNIHIQFYLFYYETYHQRMLILKQQQQQAPGATLTLDDLVLVTIAFDLNFSIIVILSIIIL